MATPPPPTPKRVPMGSVKIFPSVFGMAAEQLLAPLAASPKPGRIFRAAEVGNNQQHLQGSAAPPAWGDSGMAKAQKTPAPQPGKLSQLRAGAALSSEGLFDTEFGTFLFLSPFPGEKKKKNCGQAIFWWFCSQTVPGDLWEPPVPWKCRTERDPGSAVKGMLF